MDEDIGNFFITLLEIMDMHLISDDEDYILVNLGLFELQPIHTFHHFSSSIIYPGRDSNPDLLLKTVVLAIILPG